MKRKVTTTARRKPNKTNKKNKEGNTKPENNLIQTWEPNDQKWKQGGFEKGCQQQRSTNEERKGATKIEPKKQNENIMSKRGWWSKKET